MSLYKECAKKEKHLSSHQLQDLMQQKGGSELLPYLHQCNETKGYKTRLNNKENAL